MLYNNERVEAFDLPFVPAEIQQAWERKNATLLNERQIASVSLEHSDVVLRMKRLDLAGKIVFIFITLATMAAFALSVEGSLVSDMRQLAAASPLVLGVMIMVYQRCRLKRLNDLRLDLEPAIAKYKADMLAVTPMASNGVSASKREIHQWLIAIAGTVLFYNKQYALVRFDPKVPHSRVTTFGQILARAEDDFDKVWKTATGEFDGLITDSKRDIFDAAEKLVPKKASE